MERNGKWPWGRVEGVARAGVRDAVVQSRWWRGGGVPMRPLQPLHSQHAHAQGNKGVILTPRTPASGPQARHCTARRVTCDGPHQQRLGIRPQVCERKRVQGQVRHAAAARWVRCGGWGGEAGGAHLQTHALQVGLGQPHRSHLMSLIINNVRPKDRSRAPALTCEAACSCRRATTRCWWATARQTAAVPAPSPSVSTPPRPVGPRV